ncbi:hypothetical protein CITRIK5_20245 [Citricoccus sp. K5]|nr:hypothetical protein CITRIK5_20245 [Citricoccus sp. K5]
MNRSAKWPSFRRDIWPFALSVRMEVLHWAPLSRPRHTNKCVKLDLFSAVRLETVLQSCP